MKKKKINIFTKNYVKIVGMQFFFENIFPLHFYLILNIG